MHEAREQGNRRRQGWWEWRRLLGSPGTETPLEGARAVEPVQPLEARSRVLEIHLDRVYKLLLGGLLAVRRQAVGAEALRTPDALLPFARCRCAMVRVEAEILDAWEDALDIQVMECPEGLLGAEEVQSLCRGAQERVELLGPAQGVVEVAVLEPLSFLDGGRIYPEGFDPRDSDACLRVGVKGGFPGLVDDGRPWGETGSLVVVPCRGWEQQVFIDFLFKKISIAHAWVPDDSLFKHAQKVEEVARSGTRVAHRDGAQVENVDLRAQKCDTRAYAFGYGCRKCAIVGILPVLVEDPPMVVDDAAYLERLEICRQNAVRDTGQDLGLPGLETVFPSLFPGDPCFLCVESPPGSGPTMHFSTSESAVVGKPDVPHPASELGLPQERTELPDHGPCVVKVDRSPLHMQALDGEGARRQSQAGDVRAVLDSVEHHEANLVGQAWDEGHVGRQQGYLWF